MQDDFIDLYRRWRADPDATNPAPDGEYGN